METKQSETPPYSRNCAQGHIEERQAEETIKILPSPALLIDEMIRFEKCSLFRIIMIG
jgi:hypothetical protein